MHEPPILEFQGDYRFLSNFLSGEIIYDGVRYANLESAYQAAKCIDADAKLEFKDIEPGYAKALGRTVTIRPDWDDVRLGVMYDLLKLKFDNATYGELLLDTNERYISEGNRWGDTFWGVNLKTGEGENNLGKLLMKVRSELKHSLAKPMVLAADIDIAALYPDKHDLNSASTHVLMDYYSE